MKNGAVHRMKSKKNIALIGAGYWGKNHLKNLYKLGVLRSVMDTNIDILGMRERDFPNISYTTKLGDILENSEIKAVVIAAPAEMHFTLTKKCLLAGKDVLVEKPLSLNCHDGRELVNLSEKIGKILMVGHVLQYHPAVKKLIQIVKDGSLGAIRYIYSNRLNLGKLRAEENVLWSFAPHDISLILMLMNGKNPVQVKAFGESYIIEGIYDSTVTELEFQNKVKCHIFVSWLHPYKEQRLVVIGSENMAVFNDLTEEKLFIYPYTVNMKGNNIPVAEKAEHYPVDVEKSEPLREELLHFIDCINERKTPLTDGLEGLRVLEVLESAENCLKDKTRKKESQ